MPTLLDDLREGLQRFDFREVPEPARTIEGAVLLLKRQTWNTNRAVVVVERTGVPEDLARYVREVRNQVAYRCKFVPFFWGIGVQLVLVAPGLAGIALPPVKFVAKVDNQWAIVQSVFFADPASKSFAAGRTWGQVVTGPFQDAIAEALARHFRNAASGM